MKAFDVCTAKHLSVDGDVDPNRDNDANGDWYIIPMAVMMPIMIGTKCQW